MFHQFLVLEGPSSKPAVSAEVWSGEQEMLLRMKKGWSSIHYSMATGWNPRADGLIAESFIHRPEYTLISGSWRWSEECRSIRLLKRYFMHRFQIRKISFIRQALGDLWRWNGHAVGEENFTIPATTAHLVEEIKNLVGMLIAPPKEKAIPGSISAVDAHR